jgi:hypothetical protein
MATLKQNWRATARRFLMPLPGHMQKIVSVEGHLGQGEAQLLFDLASNVSDGCIVEVGSYRGKSTVALGLGARAAKRGVRVYAVDPHEAFVGVLGGVFGPQDRLAFFQNMLRTGCAETVRLINVSSEVVSKGWEHPIGLLWIDGDHRYEAVRRDFACWAPFLVEKGVVAFHDSLDENLGPARLIAELVGSGTYQKVSQVEITTVLQKT